ncbi:hypothetical protein CRG98_006143 [Punica granatum]|uniref:Purine permease 3-like n=3 Tax=Punica granatum TaxID=22663 RepID=A0A2I0KYN1_PUNGR|nr:hypothetical protein CRG98_006143 [Punica granatum]
MYVVGFLMTLAASGLYGFVLPLVEMGYKKTKQVLSYSLVLEYQLVMSFSTAAFCIVGMFINNDFKVIPREAKEFGLGESKYYMVLISSAIVWQCFFVGAMGVIFCASSLSSGIIIAVMLPVTEVLAVIFFREKFQVEKGVSLVLSLWGFVSYFYKEIMDAKKRRNQDQNQHPPHSEMEMNNHSLP